jgi:hypothetical protein
MHRGDQSAWTMAALSLVLGTAAGDPLQLGARGVVQAAGVEVDRALSAIDRQASGSSK